MVLKRCIYGVDKNPLTVELAKVSLWLHSFTVGAPLSFLDHHLRCGDSLVGMRVQGSIEELRRLSGLFASSAIQGAENATAGMQRIEEMSDADVAEVSANLPSLFRGVEHTTADPARPARLPVRSAMAHGGNEEEGAHRVRVAARRLPRTELAGRLQAPFARSRRGR